MIVAVDLVEILTIMVILFFGGGGLAMLIGWLILPSPARTLLKGKWLKRGKRNFVNLLNDDNVRDIKVGRPTDWGIKVEKKRFLIPRSISDLVNKRAIMSGTGLPCYDASTRSGLATSPEFVQLAQEVVNGEVLLTVKTVDPQKPKECPRCTPKNLNHTIEDVEVVVKGEDGKKRKVLSHWQCSECETVFQPVTLLNPHIMAHLVEESYDPTLIQGIEQDAKEEARLEKPGWFIWAIIALVPHLCFLIAFIMLMEG